MPCDFIRKVSWERTANSISKEVVDVLQNSFFGSIWSDHRWVKLWSKWEKSKWKSQRNKWKGFSPHWHQGVPPFPGPRSIFLQKQLCHFPCCSWKNIRRVIKGKKCHCMSVLANSWSPILLRHKAVPGDIIHLASTLCYHTVSVSSFTKARILLLAKAFNCVYTKFKRSH